MIQIDKSGLRLRYVPYALTRLLTQSPNHHRLSTTIAITSNFLYIDLSVGVSLPVTPTRGPFAVVKIEQSNSASHPLYVNPK